MPSERKAISRRQFLTRTSQVAGGMLAAGTVASLATAPSASARVIGANDQINLAVIGIKGRGNGHIGGFGDVVVEVKHLAEISHRGTPGTSTGRRDYFHSLASV